MSESDSPLSGRVYLITGANTGIGRVTANVLAERGARVVIACRSEEKAQPVVAEINDAGGEAQFLKLDLANLASVRSAASEFLALGLPLHVLINNAGIGGGRGATADGFEMNFGVNHLGHFLFTGLLLDRITESAPARIVTVASKAHYSAKSIPFDRLRQPTQTYAGMREYEVSKLANVLFSAELSRRLAGKGVSTYSLHPGVVASDIWHRVPWLFRGLIKRFMITVEEGAKTSIYCATDSALQDDSGKYYDTCAAVEPNPLASDRELAQKLWDVSEEWTSE